MKRMKLLGCWGLAMLALAGPAFADPLGEAVSTYDSGNDGKALQMLTPLAAAGSAKAQDLLAHMYFYGEGTAVDRATAHKWGALAAAQDDPRGENDVAADYAAGSGVARDDAVALKWFERAARGGDVLAEVSLARRYLYGQGVAIDVPRGLGYLRAAAAGGDQRAQLTLGRFFAGGMFGLPRDEGKAFRLFSLAAAQRNIEAQVLVGAAYLNGTGVPVDKAKAAMWWQLAAGEGCGRAGHLLAEAKADLDAAGRTEVTAMADQWNALHPPRALHQHDGADLARVCAPASTSQGPAAVAVRTPLPAPGVAPLAVERG